MKNHYVDVIPANCYLFIYFITLHLGRYINLFFNQESQTTYLAFSIIAARRFSFSAASITLLYQINFQLAKYTVMLI